MTCCERCYQPMDDPEAHGLYKCPLEPRRVGLAVRPDSIPGGIWIEHGLCNADGSPRRYDSQSEINRELAVRNLVKWTDVYSEDRTKDARVRADWYQSSEAKQAKRQRDEARAEKQLVETRRRADQPPPTRLDRSRTLTRLRESFREAQR